jgi:hypothetical protein
VAPRGLGILEVVPGEPAGPREVLTDRLLGTVGVAVAQHVQDGALLLVGDLRLLRAVRVWAR